MSSNVSANMKSTVSSSPSASEKTGGLSGVSGLGGSRVASSSGYDLEESKFNSASRMSCASDDSCAINELLEGRMDLNVTLPNSAESVVFNVERRTPMLDLLVNIATQYRFNAANYTINAGDHEFKASTPIGSLDVNQISIIPKPTKTASVKNNPVMPFQTTFRLQVNLPRNQLMVLRVTPNASIAAIKQIICSEKSLDSSKYQLVRIIGNSDAPQVLEPNKTLAYYTINEVTLVSNKTLAQIEMQFGTPTTSQVDLSTSRTSSSVSAHKKAIHSLIISQSNPDFTTIDDKTVLNHTTTSNKPMKKRPAPPPPMPSSATLPNNMSSLQINGNKNQNNITNFKNDDSIIKTAASESIIQTKSLPKLSKSAVNHVRQNSGSDSSGYHESVLSSDSPESSSAVATLPKSSSTTGTMSTTSVNNRQVVNNKAGTKKRRAPPPPSSQHLNTQQECDNKHNDNNIDENKAAVECLSDVSLPLSISSSSASESSGTASSINNRSLSPIVITQTNGSSTPKRTSVDSSEVPVEVIAEVAAEVAVEVVAEVSTEPPLELASNSSELDDRQEERLSSPTNVIDVNSSQPEPAQSEPTQAKISADVPIEEVTHSEAIIVNADHVVVDEERSPNKIEDMCQQSDNLEIKDIKDEKLEQIEASIAVNDTNDSDLNASITAITTKSDPESPTESLPKEVEVSCIAPALAVSHDHGLSGHDCVEQVEERDIIDNEKQGVNQLSSNEKSDNFSNQCESDPIQNSSELELAEMSLPLPPPSPFQNSNHDGHNSPVHECDDEMGQGVDRLNSPTFEANNHQVTAFDQMKESPDLSSTIDDKIEDTIDHKNEHDNFKSHVESEITTTPLIVSDEDKLNKEIEVTLQSLNDELDRLESKDQIQSDDLNNQQSLINDKSDANYPISHNEILTNTQEVNRNNASKVSVQVKQTIGNTSEIEKIKSKFEDRQSPSPTPRVLSVNGKSKITMNRDDTQTQVSKSSNGKTTLIVNKRDTPTPPVTPQPPSISPTPPDEDKFTAEEVRQLCRPRVKLSNFSIGSYKKDVDIYEETQRVLRSEAPATAPVISANAKPTLATVKPYVVTASVKQEKASPPNNQNKSKVNITATSTTATTTSTTKPSTPVIQTLITTAPKINRIQSWSGQKSVSLDQKYPKQPVKTNERYVSQIAINKNSKTPPPDNESENLKSPHLVVQSLIAKAESRSPSPQDLQESHKPIKEDTKHTTISIKPGLESIIRPHPKQNNSEIKTGNEVNSAQTEPQNRSQQSITIGKTQVQLKSTPTIKSPIESTQPSIEQSTQPPIPPPVPPPIPPPLPQNISSFPINNNKTSVNTKVYHTKGWNSEKVTRNGNVPKVRHVEPPNSTVDVRDALLNEIKSFGGKDSLKKVSKNSSWKLEVNGNSVKT